MNIDLYRKISKVSLGKEKADLVFKNAFVVNVFTSEIIESDVAICEGVIAGLGKYSGKKEIDVKGKYLVPGFIDSHLHFESTLLSPAQIIKKASISGTTTFIADPHEAANVCGKEGIEYILDHTENVDANVFIMMPSCVPAISTEDNGCIFDSNMMESYVSNSRVLGLGEVMNAPAVIDADIEMHKKLNLFDICDGHAPGLNVYELNAYKLAGIDTDHECTSFDYALAEARVGMQVHIREGSAAKNLEAIVKGIIDNELDTRNFCFCTDDRHIDDIIKEGHISNCVRKAINLGLDPVKAICMATINAARTYKLDNLGAIAPGYQADIIVMNDLKNVDIESVYFKGNVIDDKKELKEEPAPAKLIDSVHVKPFTKKDIQYIIKDDLSPVIRVIGGQILTQKVMCKLPEYNGIFKPNKTYNKVLVVERHKKTGKLGVGAVLGFGISKGAIASTVSHDSHNIITVGDNDDDIMLATEKLIENKGGYTLVNDGKVVKTLPLPVMGLMTQMPFEKVIPVAREIIDTAHKMGVSKDIDPLTTLSFLALPVIPEIRITTRGLLDVLINKYLI